MSIYGWVILGSITGPFLLSFDRKVAFYKYWKALFLAIVPVAIVFLIWDEYFTINKIWGFTPRYLIGYYLGHLPVEEVSFFLIGDSIVSSNKWLIGLPLTDAFCDFNGVKNALTVVWFGK